MAAVQGEASHPGDLLRAAIDQARAAVSRVQEFCGPEQVWRSQDRDVLAAVGELARVRSALEAAHLSLVRQVDVRGVAEASPVATSPEGFLRTSCLVGARTARQDVSAARATAPGATLEPFGAALAEGRCTRAHVDIAVQCLDGLPRHLLERPGAPEMVSDYLLTAATDATPVDLTRACRHLVATLAPEADDRRDPAAAQRRFLDLATDSTGMTVGQFQLDPVAGASLRVALQRWSGPESGADGEVDRRRPRQRRADALAFLVETALGVEQPRRGERPRVVVHVTPEQLAGGGPGRAHVEGGGTLPTWATRRLSCDAVLQRLVDSPAEGPLDLGRTVRLATVTQRRALAARDGGCVVPGCGAPPDVCDAHHVTHWADGGPTDLGNLCLLCPAHHTAVHAGTWSVAVDDHQEVTVTPPRWVDPTQQPRPAWHRRVRRMWQQGAATWATGAGEEQGAGRGGEPGYAEGGGDRAPRAGVGSEPDPPDPPDPSDPPDPPDPPDVNAHPCRHGVSARPLRDPVGATDSRGAGGSVGARDPRVAGDPLDARGPLEAWHLAVAAGRPG